MNKKNYIEEISWSEARNDVMRADASFAKLVDDLSPDKSFSLVKVKYPFGVNILENLAFYLPGENGQPVTLEHTDLPTKIRNQLNYNLIPLGIVVKNNVEVYKELGGKVFSLAFYGNGLDIGIWEYFGQSTPYNISAGGRSLYMLPKISETMGNKRLKRDYGLTAPAPKSFSDHHKIFVDLTHSDNFKQELYCEVIFLTKKWVDSIHKDPAWHDIQTFLLTKGWIHSEYSRRKSMFDIVWEQFTRLLNDKNHRTNPYVMDTLKHLSFVGTGTVPASAAFHGSEEAGPLKRIQEIYTDCYGLKEYIPTVMQPQYLNLKKPKPVYYSLHNPTLLESVPKNRQQVSVIENIRELKELLDHFVPHNFDPILRFEESHVSTLIHELDFKFYHGDMYAYGPCIRPSTEMPANDKTLLYTSVQRDGTEFAHNSPFVRGCVCINKRNG